MNVEVCTSHLNDDQIEYADLAIKENKFNGFLQSKNGKTISMNSFRELKMEKPLEL